MTGMLHSNKEPFHSEAHGLEGSHTEQWPQLTFRNLRWGPGSLTLWVGIRTMHQNSLPQQPSRNIEASLLLKFSFTTVGVTTKYTLKKVFQFRK